MLIKYLPGLFIGLMFYACSADTELSNKTNSKVVPSVYRDYAEIIASDTIRAITIYNSTGYFLYRGQPMGFEYELLKSLADDLGVHLKMIVAKDIDDLFNMLNRGDGDIVAYGLTITEARQLQATFSEHLYLTHQVLVQRKPDNWRAIPRRILEKQIVSDAIDLIGDTIHIREKSSYFERIRNLSAEIGGSIYIDTMPGNMTTDEIIKLVALDSIKYTISDHNIAAINKTYYPILDIETPISLSQRIAWAMRHNSQNLIDSVNKWAVKFREQDDYFYIYHKYFKSKKSYRRRIDSEFYSKNGGKISRYDDIIKQYTDTTIWDWRLIASLIYQESNFNANAYSWAGANGLMQLMPATANDLGLGMENVFDPSANIRAGTKYLNILWDLLEVIPDTVQRQKFVLASYNCGLGHIYDARRLAEKYGADNTVWDDETEEFILKLAQRQYYTDPVVRNGLTRGREPYQYVQEIYLRFDHYKQFIEE